MQGCRLYLVQLGERGRPTRGQGIACPQRCAQRPCRIVVGELSHGEVVAEIADRLHIIAFQRQCIGLPVLTYRLLESTEFEGLPARGRRLCQSAVQRHVRCTPAWNIAPMDSVIANNPKAQQMGF